MCPISRVGGAEGEAIVSQGPTTVCVSAPAPVLRRHRRARGSRRRAVRRRRAPSALSPARRGHRRCERHRRRGVCPVAVARQACRRLTGSLPGGVAGHKSPTLKWLGEVERPAWTSMRARADDAHKRWKAVDGSSLEARLGGCKSPARQTTYGSFRHRSSTSRPMQAPNDTSPKVASHVPT
jgi:hypothetical protein